MVEKLEVGGGHIAEEHSQCSSEEMRARNALVAHAETQAFNAPRSQNSSQEKVDTNLNEIFVILNNPLHPMAKHLRAKSCTKLPRKPFSEMLDCQTGYLEKQNFTNNMYQNIVNSKVNNYTKSSQKS